MNKESNDYLGSKYSEQVFGQSGGKVSDEERQRQEKEMTPQKFEEKMFWKDFDQEDYMKTQTLYDKKKALQREKVVSATNVLGDIRPSNLYRKLDAFLQIITPEEVETLNIIKNVYCFLLEFY